MSYLHPSITPIVPGPLESTSTLRETKVSLRYEFLRVWKNVTVIPSHLSTKLMK